MIMINVLLISTSLSGPGKTAEIAERRKLWRKRRRFDATVIVDDSWSRALAEKSALEVHGTLWLLQQFHRLRLLSATSVRESFLTLRLTRRRLPWDDVDDYLRTIGEQELPKTDI
jgi:hypothetical protein